MYAILRKDEKGNVCVIYVCRFQKSAEGIVNKYKKSLDGSQYWYQRVEKVSTHAEIY